MPWFEMFGYVLLALGGAVAVVAAVHLLWRLDGMRRIRNAGPRLLLAARHRIWREPTLADLSDLRFGPGGGEGVPKPPFQFVAEHFTGSQPCVAVQDAAGRLWRIKWGHEAKPESFAVRFAWALGYFVEVTHFVESGEIADAVDLKRAKDRIGDRGVFSEARFELEDPSVRMHFNEHSWAWNDNPFLGTPQLNGLKIVNMLLSNWDTKDRRDVSRGSNTAIFERRVSRWGREAQYLITDWGGAMGKWGSNVVSRDRWDVTGFEAQTQGFVTGVADGFVNFGYQGQRTAEIARGITVEDAAWFYGYAGRITETALRGGLTASGATSDEAARFARALIDRIQQIGRAASSAMGSSAMGCITEDPRRTIKAG